MEANYLKLKDIQKTETTMKAKSKLTTISKLNSPATDNKEEEDIRDSVEDDDDSVDKDSDNSELSITFT